MTTLGIIQARTGSTRLPGKVLRRLGGRTVLHRVVRAARDSGVVDDLVVATTTEAADDAVAAECARIGVACHRGPVDDVLTRFLGVLAGRDDVHTVLRFTADCPLLDPALVRRVCDVFAASGVDYLTTSITRTLPRGLDVEVVRAAVLRAIDDRATGYHRTHVTSYLYSHPDEFDVIGVTVLPDRSHLRLTLDTEDDWKLIEAIVDRFGDRPVGVAAVAEWLAEHPELVELNAHVHQKELSQA
ncbi:spore coat polysaccharide biosynthesis protein SpsF [Actinoplanes octamycinicus]|uniref:Spore coat polysaccharide biosynthesis protein SpsF n=1 Tax=Actinoplanes octamycinicus TaxID=135948 RepID=A0A7W7M6C8_9ACTN|nr:NTP transferase domain-containing protein [Actinoplanes octamycinicus]MBB4738600.1 spore coat polysaccharide biosynthesis protein SpsF [Actinoplanes octamycinicus]GIE57726.1 flagellin modification protein FlmC [Actinoplanes octamycinicus]